MYIDSFRGGIYPINNGIASNAAVATGRYSEDVYYGGQVGLLTRSNRYANAEQPLCKYSLGTSPPSPSPSSSTTPSISGSNRDQLRSHQSRFRSSRTFTPPPLLELTRHLHRLLPPLSVRSLHTQTRTWRMHKSTRHRAVLWLSNIPAATVHLFPLQTLLGLMLLS